MYDVMTRHVIKGEDNEADQSKMMQQMSATPGSPPDVKKAFKEEWEALEVSWHKIRFRKYC